MGIDLELATTRQLATELLRRNHYGIIFVCDKRTGSKGDYAYYWKGNTVEVLGCMSYFQAAYDECADANGDFTPDSTGVFGDEELEDDDKRDSDNPDGSL